MTKEQFNEICTAAFGSNYTTDVARELGVSDRTIRAWRDGSRTLPKTLDSELANLLDHRRDTVENALKSLYERMLKARLVMSHKDIGLGKSKERRDIHFYESLLSVRDAPSHILLLATSIAETEQQLTAIEEIANCINNNHMPSASAKSTVSRMLLNEFESREAIAKMLGRPFDTVFPPFIFEPANNDYRVKTRGVMRSLIEDKNGYRVSRSASKYLMKNDDYDDTRVICVTHEDEIIFVTVREFVLNGFTEAKEPM